jgi:glycosyltransferase involved in cell wall biosynthesis
MSLKTTIRQLVRRCLPLSLKAWLLARILPRRVYGVTRSLPTIVTDPATDPAAATPRKRALVSYLVGPFLLPPDDPEHVRFSNLGIARGVVQALNNLGYAVDVVDHIDRRFRPAREYDVFVGHGTHNFRPIAQRLPARTRKVFLASTTYWRFNNAQATARAQDLFRRRGVRLPPDRQIPDEEEWSVTHSDAIFGLGNARHRATFPPGLTVRSLNNAAYPVAPGAAPAPDEKDFGQARRHFLFFAGAGNVHKGLDLVLEAFAGVPDAEVWVCQEIQPAFDRAYHRELHDLPNVHLVGHVPMRGERFRELVARCAYAILPSCSEACPGSVVECMHHGLIPVVSAACGLDTGDYGVTLADCRVETLAATLRDLGALAPERCRQMARDTLAAAARDFSADGFVRQLTSILKDFTDRPAPAHAAPAGAPADA